MSFISILKRVGKTALMIERFAAPIAEAIAPEFAIPIVIGLQELFGKIQTNVLTAEMNNPQDKQGAIKSANVTRQFDDSLSGLRELLEEGMTVEYDRAALQTAINCQVAAYNAMADVRASLKIVRS